MTLSLYSALFIFATIMVITPGPANLLLMSAGAQHGFYKSVPFVIGVTCGKLFLTIGLGIGFLTLLNSNPILVSIIKVIGTAYICWLSWKILFLSFQSTGGEQNEKAPNFLNGLLVHPLNPKAWMMVILACTAFQGQGLSTETIPNIAIIFLLIQLIFHSAWFLFGAIVRKAELSEKNSRIVKIGLLISLVASIVFSYY